MSLAFHDLLINDVQSVYEIVTDLSDNSIVNKLGNQTYALCYYFDDDTKAKHFLL